MRPIVDRSNAESWGHAVSASEVLGGTRGTIVVGEDDQVTRMLLGQILTAAGYRVCAVENGKLACEAVRVGHPDAILLDWTMPVMDGLCAAKSLKHDPATRAIPIIMVTTHAEVADRTVAVGVGVQDFVTKPFAARDLLACVEQQMRWRTIIATARAVDRRTITASNE
jgi:CheY-like chemotaxis protein